MNKVVFDCNDIKFTIQCNNDDKMKDIISKYLSKSDKNKKNLAFLYNGRIIDENLTFIRCANSLDRQRNHMVVLVFCMENVDNDLVKSKYIICPKCKENAFISIKNFRISITGCKSGHKTEDLDLKEFIETQNIDESNIKCDKCEKSKNETQQNKLFTCNKCNINLCSLCKNTHDESHINYMKDYDENKIYCKTHFENYTNYCTDCKKDICNLCINEHEGHKFINYDNIIKDFDKIKAEELKETKEKLYEIKTIVDGMIAQLKNFNINLNSYFDIYDNIFSSFDTMKRNYSLLQNINNLKKFNDSFITNITEIIKDNNMKTKFTNIISLQSKIDFKKFKKNEQIIKNEIIEIKTNEIKTDKNNNNKIIKNNNNESNDNNERNKKNITMDNNYENFNVSNIEELQSFNTKNEVNWLLTLIDGRIMTYQILYDNNDDAIYKLCVYSEKNKFSCDINIDFENSNSFILMDDGHIIVNTYNDEIKIIDIKKDKIEEIWKFDKKSDYIQKLSTTKLLIYVKKDKSGSENELYTYDKDKLIFYKNINKIYKERPNRKYQGDYAKNICHINEDEFILYVNKKGKLYGRNECLIFYDMKNNKEIKSLKVGKGENSNNMVLVNKENLLVEGEKSTILVNVKKRKITKELEFGIELYCVIILNEKSFLSYRLLDEVSEEGYLEQYEFQDSDNILLKEKKEFNYELSYKFVSKYSGNKVVIYNNNKKITIYG